MNIHSAGSLTLGDLLKTFRTRQRLTQQQLASALGMHRHAIVRWEQGDVLPATRGLVLELARHLHLDEAETRQLLEASLTALAPYWGVPLPRNSCFTGREALLEVLHQQLGVQQGEVRTHAMALQGLGGVGKTQIALEYAYRHALEYSAVFWIAAETEEQIVSSLLRIAGLLQLPARHAPEQQHVVAAVHRWLTTHSQWLLLWDNLDDLDLLPQYLPHLFIAARYRSAARCASRGPVARVPLRMRESLAGWLTLSPLDRAELLQECEIVPHSGMLDHLPMLHPDHGHLLLRYLFARRRRAHERTTMGP